MTAPFEDLPTTPRAEELVDQAFSRAARAGRAKSGVDAQESMLQTAGNVLSDNLQNVVTSWPDFSELDQFHYELADAIVNVDEVRQDGPTPRPPASTASRRSHGSPASSRRLPTTSGCWGRPVTS
jgi:hypothetical protein